MSNFICSECGMTNIDCGYAGYKTPKEIELEKKLEIATKALNRIREIYAYNPGMHQYIAQFANRKAKTDLKEMEGVK